MDALVLAIDPVSSRFYDPETKHYTLQSEGRRLGRPLPPPAVGGRPGRGRLDRGILEGVANAVLIKPNQVGTLTETVATVQRAHQAGWGAMVSHRGGETLDPFVAGLAVGLNTGHLKAGAPCRGERLAKYNQLIRIEKLLGTNATYAGRAGFVR